jgi:hypothetical protein
MKKLFSLVIFTTIFHLQDINSQGGPKDLTGDLKNEERLIHPVLVKRFYTLNSNNKFWTKQDLRSQLIHCIDTAFYLRLIQKKYHFEELSSCADSIQPDSIASWKTDRLYTDAAIAFCKDLYQGYKMRPWVGYDQLSEKYLKADDEYLLQRILTAYTADNLWLMTASLEPAHKEYRMLKDELTRQLEKNHADTVQILQLSMNYYRWIHHFRFEKLIVINLPDARLRYYENDSLQLNMKVVVGRASTPTPRFATISDQVTLYPYWYVPQSITFNEYLPKIKQNPLWIDTHNMQVIDGSGKIMDHLKMNWASYHAGYFPYTIRQSTGCDNALGVIKFNIISPYGVYLHDTNNKAAFLSGLRYYSHGCIRIEEPLELGNKLLAGKLDTAFLQSCFKERKPEFIKLEKPVPVFSVYMQATVDEPGRVHYYKDVYKLAQ